MQNNLLKYQYFSFHPELKQIVKYLWGVEAKPNDGDYFIFRTYATIYPTILFTLKGFVGPINKGVGGNILLVGQSNEWCRYKASGDFKIFGITLYPFALPLLFNVSATSVTNKNLGLDFIAQNKLLEEFCLKVIVGNFNLDLVNMMLLEMIKTTSSKDEKVLSQILGISSGYIDIAGLTSDHLNMSQRNFERKFKYYSGFTPKTFANLIRLIKSFKAISFGQATLSDTVFELSYFDQAHFSNEFKKHTGFSPKVFLKKNNTDNLIWESFVDFFQFLSICPPILCKNKIIQEYGEK